MSPWFLWLIICMGNLALGPGLFGYTISRARGDFVTFKAFFREATRSASYPEGSSPYPYQERLARAAIESRLVHIPTGCGKTAAAILAWLWRRRFHPDHSIRTSTPRRLVYCLPMRVLVEQTRDNARTWLRSLGLQDRVRVRVLMGGEEADDWDLYPERDAILVGTQDMLLSRALNRGYAMSRYKWPVHFGLLNNDCLWVCDEVQLMGSALHTTAQLQAFRENEIFGTFGPAATWWMSATMDLGWFDTVDFKCWTAELPLTHLEDDDFGRPDIVTKYNASKPIVKTRELAPDEISKLHAPGTLTLVVVNTVGRAQALYDELLHAISPEPLLAHSRFRPCDRERLTRRLTLADRVLRGETPQEVRNEDKDWIDEVRKPGLVVVATQVVEAGLDISAQTLLTEIAPWESLVQRFGRCNRFGKQSATIGWLDLGKEQALPYEESELEDSRKRLAKLTKASANARIADLETLGPPQARPIIYAIRQHDLHGLFSTERDLAGGFTDVSRFVRDSEREIDVYLFWRDFEGRPDAHTPAPRRDELCHVPAWELRQLLGKVGLAWEWEGESNEWVRRRGNDVRPGMTLLLRRAQGGYSDAVGWTRRPGDKPSVHRATGDPPESLGSDPGSQTDWLPLADHLRDAEAEARPLVGELGIADLPTGAVVTAARWHDVGKLHVRWQDGVRRFVEQLTGKIDDLLAAASNGLEAAFLRNFLDRLNAASAGDGIWAKFPDFREAIRNSGLSSDSSEEVCKALHVQFRPGLRHEAASALAAWQQWREKADGWTALAVYLAAAHHGKVRTVLRSRTDAGDDVFGIRPGETLPTFRDWLPADLRLDLTSRAFGAGGGWDDDHNAFTVESPSWVSVIAELLGPELASDSPVSSVLRKDEPKGFGPFRLAFLEALVAIADVRASRKPGLGKAP